MSKFCLKSRYAYFPLHRVGGMAVPQLVWVKGKPAARPNFRQICPMACRVRCLSLRGLGNTQVSASRRPKPSNKASVSLETRTTHSAFGSFAEEVNLTTIGENFDALPTDRHDLKDPATQ